MLVKIIFKSKTIFFLNFHLSYYPKPTYMLFIAFGVMLELSVKCIGKYSVFKLIFFNVFVIVYIVHLTFLK